MITNNMNRARNLLAIPFLLTILACGGNAFQTLVPPVIIGQPSSVTVGEAAPATFTVLATGEGVTYQWQKQNGSAWDNVTSGTNNTYTVASVAAIHAGKYRVQVINGAGTVNSNEVDLNLSPN